MSERLAYFLIKIAARIVQSLSIETSLLFARILGHVAYCVDKRRFVAYANIKAAFPNEYTPAEIRAMVRKSYVHFAQMFVEILYFPKMDKAYIEKYMEGVNFDRYERIAESKKGGIAITAHYGNWELSQIFSSLRGYPLYMLIREQKMNRLNDFLNEVRTTHGTKLLRTKGMEIREFIRVLKEGNIVGAAGDQGGGRDGIRVDFFGRKTTAPRGLMTIATRTGASVIPSFCRRKQGPYHAIHISKPLELVQTGDEEKDDRENIRCYLDQLEKWISEKPEEWLWLHKRWKFRFTKRAIVLQDEKAGHASQAQAIGREIESEFNQNKDNEPLRIESIPVRFKNPISEILFLVFSTFFIPFAQSRLGMLRWFFSDETCKQIENIPYADFIVSAGSKLAPLSLWLSREFQAKTVNVMKPPFPFSLFHYDLLIFPKHDSLLGIRSPHVQTLVAPNLVAEELLERAKQEIVKQMNLNGRVKVSVFIGGSSKLYHFDSSRFKIFLSALSEEAERSNLDLMITTSRRTDAEFEKMVKEHFGNHPRCKLLVIANEKNIPNVIYGMLALSDIVLVTEESVSMISEALSAGKEVVVAEVGNGALSEKHKRFKSILLSEHIIRTAAPARISAELHLSTAGHPRKLIQKEREEIREAIRRLL